MYWRSVGFFALLLIRSTKVQIYEKVPYEALRPTLRQYDVMCRILSFGLSSSLDKMLFHIRQMLSVFRFH